MYAVRNLGDDNTLKVATFKGLPDSNMLTAKGLDLTLEELKRLKDTERSVSKVIPELAEVTPCFLNESHQAQEGYFTCQECNPFTDFYDFD